MVGHLALGQSVPVIPGVFHFTLIYNTGIAFGFFQNSGLLLFAVISLSIVLLILAGPRLAGDGLSAQISMALILGGALGNWIDRCRVHAVIDFLDFQVWPVFNIADSAITVGVGLYLLKFVCDKFRKSTPAS
jgi:signal peptidase II